MSVTALVQQAQKVSLDPNLPLQPADQTSPNTSSPTEELIATSEYLQGSTSQPDPTRPSFPNPANSWTSGVLTTARLDNFAATILPPKVQINLAQPFGKDSLLHSFYSQNCFRHVLLPVLKSGFLSCKATKNLEKASRRARQLQMLRKKYSKVDFLPLQGFQPDWESTTTIQADWKAMTSACLLHFDGDVATMVRWIGGPHVNAHLDIPAMILAKLRLIVDPDIFSDISRIFLLGAPAKCTAEASEENFQAFRTFKHTATTLPSPKTRKSTLQQLSSKVKEG